MIILQFLSPIALSMIIGILILLFSKKINYAAVVAISSLGMVLVSVLTCMNILNLGKSVTLFYLLDSLPIYMKLDEIGVVFSMIITVIWCAITIYSYVYLKNNENINRYFGFYFLVYGILIGSHYSGNIITFYLFYELLTICSTPLVLHNQTREAKMAGFKYMFYSFCGAYMILFGIFFVNQCGGGLEFFRDSQYIIAAGTVNKEIFLVAIFVMILGFGVKAGMFPFHAWLWAAHPVAPAPASAVLSSVIVKTGVLGIIRVVYYLVGTNIMAGTWVQTTILIFSMLTIFMGSMLAFREDVLKKRLAYSTISQLSYIILGIFLFTEQAFTGSMLHVAAHAMIKCSLFLVAGAIIFKTDCHRVSELKGIGKKMPITMLAFTIASLGLIGIPPTGGFISKWYIALGALSFENKLIGIVGVIILLISAMLTAGYLLPISINGFFTGEDDSRVVKREAPISMLIPIIVLVVISIIIGVVPNFIIDFIR